jgi:hypothetical protein
MDTKVKERQYQAFSIFGLLFTLLWIGWLFFYNKWLFYSPLVGGVISLIVVFKATNPISKKIAWVALSILFLEIIFVGYLFYSLFHGGLNTQWGID